MWACGMLSASVTPISIVIPTMGTRKVLCAILDKLVTHSNIEILVSYTSRTVPCRGLRGIRFIDMQTRNSQIFTLHRFEAASLASHAWVLHYGFESDNYPIDGACH